ncbi:MAG: helix-turn-helix domain-containing protein [Amphiplicatus sp.]
MTSAAAGREKTGARAAKGAGSPEARSASPALPDHDRGVASPDGSTAARIERAALALFVAQGIDAATTREIAAAAGLSEGALYRHFPSKEAIAETLFVAIHERLARLVRGAARAGASLGEQADAVVDAYCRTADEDWTLFAYHLLSTAHFLPTPPGADNPVAAAEEIVAAAMARGEIENGDAPLLAAMALGAVLQPALHKAYGRLEGPLTVNAPALKRAVRAVLFSQ